MSWTFAGMMSKAGRDVDLYTIAAAYSPRRALELAHAEVPANAVLCGKLIAALWLFTGQVVYARAEAVPFAGIPIGGVDGLPFLQLALLAQLSAILTILCSPFFRVGCALLALIILSLSALDQALFSNNRVFCAAVLLMLALDPRGRLARAQVALVYACAATDKLLTVAWRSGQFVRTFSAELCRVGELWSPGWSPGGALPLTCALARVLSDSASLALLASGLVIATELIIALGYASRARFTAALAPLFHALLLTLTGGTFGVFFYAGTACSLLVLDLERQAAPFDRALPYAVIAALLAGPWLRPWFGLVFSALVLGLALRRAPRARAQVTG